MRCLYCGKELALLKRLRGGGEFCSDAHRQQYQQEYNQLALNRLLQAKPEPGANPEHSSPEVGPLAAFQRSEGDSLNAAPIASQPQIQPAIAVAERPASIAVTTQPAAVPVTSPSRKDEPGEAAPLAAWVQHLPRIAEPTPIVLQMEPSIVPEGAASLPSRPLAAAAQEGHFELGGKVAWRGSGTVDIVAKPRERSVEVREFSRTAPVVELAVLPALGVGSFAAGGRVEIERGTFVAPGDSTLWSTPAVEFALWAPELGDLARLMFEADREGLPGTDAPAQDSTKRAVSEPARPAQMPLRASRMDQPVFSPEEASPLPLEPARLDPVIVVLPGSLTGDWSAPKSTAAALTPEPDLRNQEVPAALQVKPLQPATRRADVTLEAIAAERGRPMQVWTAGLRPRGEVQIPMSGSMPLRPLMVFGPSPDKEVLPPVEIKPEIRQEVIQDVTPKPERIPSPASAPKQLIKGKPDTEAERRASKVTKKSSGKSLGLSQPTETTVEHPKPVIAEKPSVPEVRAKAAVPPAVTPAVTPVDKPLPKPMPAPITELDLGLPTLHLEGQQSFWTRLPIAARLGIAAVFLAAISGVAYLVTNGNPANATSGQPVPVETVIAGRPISDGAWVEDWAPDPNPRRSRHVSIFKSSLPLSDYRVQFEAQIETKALGWVYRAIDPQNFYVAKIEVVKPGIEPTLALVRFAVIKGQEVERTQQQLDLKTRVDTLYKVRFDAIGNKFTAWVGEKKIGEWTDDRLSKGSPGMYSERGESALVKGNMNVMPLVVRKP